MSGTQLNYRHRITDAAQVFWGGEVGPRGDTLRALLARPVSFRMLYTPNPVWKLMLLQIIRQLQRFAR